MTIDKFLTQFKVQNEDKIEEFVSKHIVKKYVSYAEKIAYCQTILNNSSYVKIDEENKIYKKNTPLRFVLFTTHLINLYTDIDIDFNNVLKSFDKLNEAGAINYLVACMPESEYTEFTTILSMVEDDMQENERSFAGYLETKIAALTMMFKGLADVFNEDSIKQLIGAATSTEE